MFDMATATDLATDAQSALGLTVSDAGENLANLTRVTDVLVKANTLANASVQQFSEALTTKSGAALKVVNKDIEEGVAVLAAFADRGVKGAEAGDKLNQVLRDIPRATAKNKSEFAALGLEMFDAEGNMRNVADIIEELDSVLGPMSDEMKAATLDQLGLNRGVADAVKILSGAGDQIRNYEKALRDSAGVTEEVADNQLESLKAQLGLAKDKFIDLGLAIIEEYEPAMLEAIKSTNAFLDVLSGRAPDDIKDLLRGFDGLFKVLSYLNPAFKRGTSFVSAYEEAQANIKRANFGKSYVDIDQALHDFNITQTDARRNA
jgi:TP901 family phage tail tape measure protein